MHLCRPFSHKKLVLSAFSVLVIAASVLAAGVVDRGFGIYGRVVAAPEGAVVTSMAGNSDLLVAGNFLSGESREAVFIRRLRPDGGIDNAFATNGTAIIRVSGADLFIEDIAILPSGSVVAVGSARYSDGTSDLFLAKITEGGSIDASFADGGVALFDLGKHESLNSIQLAADGSLLAAGGTASPELAAVVVSIGSTGRLDSGFGESGVARFSFQNTSFFDISLPSDIESLPDGRIRVGGDWEFTLDGVERIGSYFVDFDRSGSPIGLDATPYVRKDSYLCGGGFDGEVLSDGRYIHGSRHGGITAFHDASQILELSGNRIAAVGGCLGGSLKIYSSDDLRILGTDSDMNAIEAVEVEDGSLAVLTEAGEIVMLEKVTSAGTRQQNFGNDDRADFAVFRPGEQKLFINDGRGNVKTINLGSDATRVIPELAVFHSSNEGVKRGTIGHWSIGRRGGAFGINELSGSVYLSHSAGDTDDIPFAGDFDADGAVDTGVFRPSEGNWYQKLHFASEWLGEPVKWGSPGDKPVPADYDGDGRTDLAVYRPSNGTWWIKRSSDGGTQAVQFGVSADVPLAGDFDADGKADLSVFRPHEGIWYQYLTSEGFRVIRFGSAQDIPVPADYDGDGRFDIAVYRQGTWFLLQSSDGFAAFQWGAEGDRPVTARYDS
ncbi:MAG: hypothetical protein DWQ47_13275 [Acidobacteria bacterium]|nr:MAG: hypothetical protein DWQ32_00675 [Acidobacteriota bacterium]REK02950.1 MAG: hypothetical protein DWQ38_11460 [Acidobacteriota bacterium]REK13246.1 MAG: hypothetical protein DWQ43_06365 [Acidobacteriota bacterium]REK41240.1 MAG: hypothetical protein DWQ47_13275 [Acidobacteriota bacterium]